MPVITCLSGPNWLGVKDYLNGYYNAEHNYEYESQSPKAQVNVETRELIDKAVQTYFDLVVETNNQEQVDESGGRQKSTSNQSGRASKQSKESKNDKQYESGSSEDDDEQSNDDSGDDDENDKRDRRRNNQGYEGSGETSDGDEDDDDDEEEEYEGDEEDDDQDEESPSPPPPPSSRKRKTQGREKYDDSRGKKIAKRRKPESRSREEEEEETQEETSPIDKRSKPEKKIIHEYYREIGRSGKDEFNMEDHFNSREIKVIHNFLSEISRMRGSQKQTRQQKRDGGDGRRTSSGKRSGSRQGRLQRKHSDIYDSFSKQDQNLIHDYYRQIGHKGGKYRGSEVSEEELDEEDRKVHPGFLKEKKQRQQNVVHEFLSKVAKEKRWGQQPSTKQQKGSAGKMRSKTPREM